MDVLDYRSSFVINTSAVDGVDRNTCRTQIMARCVVDNRATGESGDFFLGKECIGETMYSDTGVAQVPTSEVSIVFSQGKSALNKKFADHRYDLSQVGGATVNRVGHNGESAYWTNLSFHLKNSQAYRLECRDDIVKATLDCKPMTGRTTLRDDDGQWHATIEYPIMYMNVHPPTGVFQVDAGPLLVPDFNSTSIELVERLEYAYVMYNQLEKAEFALRKPTGVGKKMKDQTLHYSEIVCYTAINELFLLGN